MESSVDSVARVWARNPIGEVMTMTNDQRKRLLDLLAALYLEFERLDWEDREAFECCPDEVDDEFDLMPSMDENAVDWDADLPDETDVPNWPLCVECGNFTPSCVC